MLAELECTTPRNMGAYAQLKRSLIGGLTGRVLEIGAGTGANFSLLDARVDWVGLEPNRTRRWQLEHPSQPRGGTILDGVAEQIPMPDASVDAVLATIVLCSVRSQEQTLAEVVRVLRPGGRFVFFEHVAAPRGSWTRRLQGVAAPFSRVFDHGCDPARKTWRALERAPFRALSVDRFTMPGALGADWPFIGGFGVA